MFHSVDHIIRPTGHTDSKWGLPPTGGCVISRTRVWLTRVSCPTTYTELSGDWLRSQPGCVIALGACRTSVLRRIKLVERGSDNNSPRCEIVEQRILYKRKSAMPMCLIWRLMYLNVFTFVVFIAGRSVFLWSIFISVYNQSCYTFNGFWQRNIYFYAFEKANIIIVYQM